MAGIHTRSLMLNALFARLVFFSVFNGLSAFLSTGLELLLGRLLTVMSRFCAWF